jgi:hypothetical protein
MTDYHPLYDLPDTATALGHCSRSTLYRLIESGKLVRVNIGSKAVITGESIAAFIEELKSTETATRVSAPDQQRHSQKRQGAAGDRNN